MPQPNKIPEAITKADFEAALRVLGIQHPGSNLVSMHFDLIGRRLAVVRNVKAEDGTPIVGGTRVTVEVAIGGDV